MDNIVDLSNNPVRFSTLGIISSNLDSLYYTLAILTYPVFQRYKFFYIVPVLNGAITFLEPTEPLYTNVLTNVSSVTPSTTPSFCLYPRDIVYLSTPRSNPEIDSRCPY